MPKQFIKRIVTFIAAAASLAALPVSLAAAEITVGSDDTMRFTVATIEAKAGETLTIHFENNGNLPKAAMGHNLVILKPGVDVAAFANNALMAAANEYIPTDPNFAAQVVAHSKMLGPKEKDTFTVTFDAPGSYPFICSFPGHWAIMKGVVTVE